ncbi:MAG: U32 family peptidase [Victivallales bacterium]|jgi:putative protease|nr:U32 family peptidase [Victivallales bacterium]
MKTPELLAPAGNLETALAAYDAGADAVYCGLGKFNARERAENFTPDSLSRLLTFAHSRNKKLYLTLNTLLKEQELCEVAEYLAILSDLSPDALIVQDLGVLYLSRKYFPSLTLHASTQMGVHNSAGVAMAERLGVKRVILERQITLEELRSIARKTSLELEVFIHGSLCCSLSGQCLLSSAMGGWSGNRGKCKQPCRRCYNVNGNRGFLLSPRDLYGVPLLGELRRIGVSSLKLEGRLRSPDYVWKTVKAYRLLLNGPIDSPPELLQEAESLLRSSATRRPSKGFFFASEYGSLIDADRLGTFGIAVARVEKCTKDGITVTVLERMHLGDRLRLVPPTGGEGESFTLISLNCRGKEVIKASKQMCCFIPGDFTAQIGCLLYKIGENGYDFSRQSAALPAARFPLNISLQMSRNRWCGTVAELSGKKWEREVDFALAQKNPFGVKDAQTVFGSAVPEPWSVSNINVEIDGEFFVPSSVQKSLRREFWQWVISQISPELLSGTQSGEALQKFYRDYQTAHGVKSKWSPNAEVFVIPAFTPESELVELRRKIQTAYGAKIRRFLVGGLYGLELLRELPRDIEIVTIFPFWVCNSLSTYILRDYGVAAAEPAAELDRASLNAFADKSVLPLFLTERQAIPLLVTRLKLKRGKWVDNRGNIFQVKSEDGLSKLYSEAPVNFEENGWK